jgi:hypothetical protein
MAYDKDKFAESMETYFDKKTDWDTFAALGTGLSKPARQVQACESTRKAD